ncbi:MAG: amidohydrolase family protein [Planctomycetota bacterium]|nr:amidohydrolase family protein [Planctomycetota bacterium]
MNLSIPCPFVTARYRSDKHRVWRAGLQQPRMGSAYAGFGEQQVGSLKAGKLADFVVFSGDPTKMDADELRSLRAERVFVGGQETHRAQ